MNLYWNREVARRINEEYGTDVIFELSGGRGFFTSTFDPSGMTEDQIFDEIVKRADICRKAYTYALTSRKEEGAFYKEFREKIKELEEKRKNR